MGGCRLLCLACPVVCWQHLHVAATRPRAYRSDRATLYMSTTARHALLCTHCCPGIGIGRRHGYMVGGIRQLPRDLQQRRRLCSRLQRTHSVFHRTESSSASLEARTRCLRSPPYSQFALVCVVFALYCCSSCSASASEACLFWVLPEAEACMCLALPGEWLDIRRPLRPPFAIGSRTSGTRARQSRR